MIASRASSTVTAVRMILGAYCRRDRGNWLARRGDRGRECRHEWSGGRRAARAQTLPRSCPQATGRCPDCADRPGTGDIASEAFRSLGLLPDEEEAYQEAQAILL